MTLQLGPLRQVSQPVASISRAIAWYRDVLGLRHIATFGQLAFFDLSGVRLFLEQVPEHREASVLYLAVDSLDHAYAELAARGVQFVDEPHVLFTDAGGTFGEPGMDERMAFFRDSEGNLLALSSREPTPG